MLVCTLTFRMSNFQKTGGMGGSKKKKDDGEYQFYGSVDDRGRRTWDTKAYELKAKYGHAGREGLS